MSKTSGHPHTLGFRGVFHCPDSAGPLGQLDQRHPNVINHRHQHLADIVELAFTLTQHIALERVMDRRNRRHLLNTIDQPGNLIPKLFSNFLKRHPLFPNRAVQHGRYQTGLIQV